MIKHKAIKIGALAFFMSATSPMAATFQRRAWSHDLCSLSVVQYVPQSSLVHITCARTKVSAMYTCPQAISCSFAILHKRCVHSMAAAAWLLHIYILVACIRVSRCQRWLEILSLLACFILSPSPLCGGIWLVVCRFFFLFLYISSTFLKISVPLDFIVTQIWKYTRGARSECRDLSNFTIRGGALLYA